MTRPITEIINETKQLLMQKRAEYEEKEALVGKDPSTYPGAEHDAPCDANQSPDPEVDDKGMRPAGASSTEGAGDDSPMTRGQATTDGDPAPVHPTEKPEVTADANAKTAAQADDLLARIRKYQQAKQAEDTTTSVGTEKGAAAVTDQPEPRHAEPEVKSKEAGNTMELTQEVLAKMAAFALSTEEGYEFMESQLAKAAGAEAATELLGFISEQDQELAKQAAYEAGAADAAALLQRSVTGAFEKGAKDAASVIAEAALGDAFVKGASDAVELLQQSEKAGKVDQIKSALAEKVAAARATNEYYKLGQAVADEAIQAAAPGAEAGMGQDMPLDAMVPGAAGGGDSEDEEAQQVAEALAGLVADGTISEDELAEILQVIEAGEGGEALPEGGDEEPDAKLAAAVNMLNGLINK